MFNLIANFDNIVALNKLIKCLRKNPKVKGHILVINKNDIITEDERYISGVLVKRSREISRLGLDNTLKGIIFGAIIGGISPVVAILLNVNLLGLSTIALLGILAIIFYGAVVGSVIGLLITNLVSKYHSRNIAGEATLILKEIDDNVKDDVINTVKEYTPEKFSIY